MRIDVRFFTLALLVALASCSGAGMSPAPVQQPQGVSSAAVGSAPVTAPFSYSVHPKIQHITDLLTHNCPGGTACALTPAQMNNAYDYSYFPGKFDGSKETIVIVDAYGSPTIQADLATFDGKSVANLPAPPSFKIDYPGGKPSVNLGNLTQLGWAEETTLDVEWAHAAAPGANIVLVVANNDQGSTVQNAIQHATSAYPGSIVSLSFGVQEAAINGGANNTQIQQAHQIYSAAANTYNDTVIASAGDQGSSGLGFGFANPQYPASDPYVLSTGGTSLTLANNTGKYGGEAAWNDQIGGSGATGGAPSGIWDQSLLPDQKALAATCAVAPALANGCRQVADLSFAGSDNAVLIYIGFSAAGVTPGLYAAGGTSVGPPMIAGIIAVADQQRLKAGNPQGVGWITDKIYKPYTAAQSSSKAPFHDITSGTNIFVSGLSCCGAGPGYDNPTGLGTPDVNNLVSYLSSL